MQQYTFNHSNSTLITKGEVSSLTILGSNNKLLIKNEVLNLVINGNFNDIKATFRKSFLTNIVFNGDNNKVEVKESNTNVNNVQSGHNNKILANGQIIETHSNHNIVTNRNGSNILINVNSNDDNAIDEEEIMNIINSVTGLNMNLSLGQNGTNSIDINGFNNNDDEDGEEGEEEEDEEGEEEEDEGEEEEDDNGEGENENELNHINEEDNPELVLFNHKKDKFILELNEFQFKHIKKYSKSKENKCAICLLNYKSSDIIKEIPCKHFYHKICILKWLKTSNICPLCKYDITNDIQKYEPQCSEDDDS